MTTQAAEKFQNLEDVKRLVEQHRSLIDEPLLMAIYYKPGREAHDIFIFEVIENFGGGAVDEDKEFFEVSYASPSGFPLEQGRKLHLVLTNPEEFTTAVHEKWQLLEELKAAIGRKEYLLLFVEPGHSNLPELIDA